MRFVIPSVVNSALFLAFCGGGVSVVKAQQDPEALVRIVERITGLEDEVRDLRGHLEESRHEVTLLKKKLEVLNADLDVRFQSMPSEKSPVAGREDPGHHQKDPSLSSDSPSTQSPEAAYEHARAFLEGGNYEEAEKGLSLFLEAYPQHAQAGAALYWLGVIYFLGNNLEKAAASFAKVYRTYPQSSKVPESLFKLAKTLHVLGRKADACTTLDQLSKDFPAFSPREIAAERNTYSCP